MAEDIVRRTSAPVAANIRAAAEQFGRVEVNNIDWSVGSVLSSKVKDAIVSALNSDLYIDPSEARSILTVAKYDERLFVEALLGHLREQPPLLSRERYLQRLLAQRTCSLVRSFLLRDCVTESDKRTWRREIQERINPALQKLNKE